MGLLTSILNLAVVVGAGWFVIYYLIPKIESGEFEGLGLPSSSEKGGSEGSGGEEELVANDLADAVTGDELGTTDAIPDEEPAAVVEKKKKKPPYDPSKGIAGKGESKKKKAKTKAEYRIIEYIGGSYGLY